MCEFTRVKPLVAQHTARKYAREGVRHAPICPTTAAICLAATAAAAAAIGRRV